MENEFKEIAEIAKKHKRVQTLMHYVNKENLKAEHKRQKPNKATGVDGMTKEKYEENLDENLSNVIAKMKKFQYRPQNIRRTYIPKSGSDKLRPLGIPAYEDKLVQGVMRNVLDGVYEGKFMEFSYGFRKGRNAHQAIKATNQILMTKKANFVVDADIKGFFDNVDHKWMIKFLSNDIEDKNFLRYISRFLKSGIIEDLKHYKSDKGTPQGGAISPILANIYLHYVLDVWFEYGVKKHAKGQAHIVRYADDFLCFFQYENEAESFMEMLKARLAKFNLELSEDKSKMIRFGRFTEQHSENKKMETFDFLGFTHINGKTRTNKYRVIHRTSKVKLKEKKQAIKEWLKINMHEKPKEIIARLNRKIAGHYAYYGISGNYDSLLKFYRFIVTQLYKTLRRRGQRNWLNYERYYKLLIHFPIKKPKLYVNIW